MKQYIILIITTIILIFAGIWEIKYFDNTSEYMQADVDYIINALNNNNFELAKNHLKSLDESWSNIKDVWNIFIEHQEIDKVESEIIKYKEYVSLEKKEEALVSGNVLKYLLNHVASTQDIQIDTVF